MEPKDTNKPKFSVEQVIQIWNDSTGERVEVGPDRDSLDLVEIRQYDSLNAVVQRVTLTQEQAVLLARAIRISIPRSKIATQNHVMPECFLRTEYLTAINS